MAVRKPVRLTIAMTALPLYKIRTDLTGGTGVVEAVVLVVGGDGFFDRANPILCQTVGQRTTPTDGWSGKPILKMAMRLAPGS